MKERIKPLLKIITEPRVYIGTLLSSALVIGTINFAALNFESENIEDINVIFSQEELSYNPRHLIESLTYDCNEVRALVGEDFKEPIPFLDTNLACFP